MQEPTRRITSESSKCIVRVCTFAVVFVSAVCWCHSMRAVLIAVNKYVGLDDGFFTLFSIRYITCYMTYYLPCFFFQYYILLLLIY